MKGNFVNLILRLGSVRFSAENIKADFSADCSRTSSRNKQELTRFRYRRGQLKLTTLSLCKPSRKFPCLRYCLNIYRRISEIQVQICQLSLRGSSHETKRTFLQSRGFQNSELSCLELRNFAPARMSYFSSKFRSFLQVFRQDFLPSNKKKN